jgi:hypothetical protein
MRSPFSELVKHKFIAALVHMSGSVLLALICLVLVFQMWYPSPLHAAIGVTQIFLLVLGVDVVIGPLLTFVVFKPGKKTLKFDLSVIVLLQLIALSYGLYTVMIGRPAWVVYNVDRFDVVRAYELQEQYQTLAKPEYAAAPLWGPRWVAAVAPTDVTERNKLTFESVEGHADLAQRPNLYAPLLTVKAAMQKRAKPLDKLKALNVGNEALVAETLKKYPLADSFVPLKAPIQDMTVLLRKDTAEVVAVVALKPW